MMKANIIGADWESSYLAEDPNSSRSKQVISDLNKYINDHKVQAGDVIDIDILNHSFACEVFQVKAVFKKSGIVKIEYIGGAS